MYHHLQDMIPSEDSEHLEKSLCTSDKVENQYGIPHTQIQIVLSCQEEEEDPETLLLPLILSI